MNGLRLDCRTSCRFCGRRWDHTSRSETALSSRRGGSNAFGFVVAAKLFHESRCKALSPEERRKANAAAEKRWARNPPRSRIVNDSSHPGVGQ